MKVCDLEGLLLDLWVARAEKIDAVVSDIYPNGTRRMVTFYSRDEDGFLDGRSFSPSEDPSDGHPIIEIRWIGTERPSKGQTPPVWRALTENRVRNRVGVFQPVVAQYGNTALIASMRCLVESVYGPEVPDVEIVTGMA